MLLEKYIILYTIFLLIISNTTYVIKTIKTKKESSLFINHSISS